MPSLWDWILKGKHKIKSSRKKGSDERSVYRYKQSKQYNPSKRDIGSNDLNPGWQSSLVNEQSKFGNVSPNLKVIESVAKDEIKDRARHGKKQRYDNVATNGRFPAYKFFGDEYKPIRNVDNERSGYHSNLNSDNYSASFSQNSWFFFHKQENENAYNIGVEMRQKRPDLFGGVASKFHRHSLPIELPRHGSDIRKRPEFLKSETMTGYVPRAISLYDASAILSGGVMEQALLPKHIHSRTCEVPNPRENKLGFLNGVPNFKTSSSNQRDQLLITREPSKDSVHYLSRNKKQTEANNNKFVKLSASSSSKSRLGDLNVKSSHRIESFYFNSSMLNHFQSGIERSSPFKNADTLTSRDAVKERDGKSSVHSRNKESGNNNNKKDDFNSNHKYWENKSYPMSNSVLNQINDFPGESRSNESKNDNTSYGGVNSILIHLDKVIDDSSCPFGANQLEVMFNTGCEVLY